MNTLRKLLHLEAKNNQLGVPLKVGYWPYLQSLDRAEKLVRDKHSSLLRTFLHYGSKNFVAYN
jgi:hypothetical protein